MKTFNVNYKDINRELRFDGSYHLSEGVIYLKKLRSRPHTELQNLSSKIFTAGRNKRIYTDKKYGFPYLSNTDISNSNPISDCKYNSKKYGYDENSFLKQGMIVTGRVGAIGQSSFINSEYEDKMAMGSDNIIRIVPNDFELSGYIYAFFASKYGKTLLWQLATGGVQPYISEEMLLNLPIPKFEQNKQNEIHNLVFEASKLRVEANKLLDRIIIEIESKYNFNKNEKIFSLSISDIKKGDKYTKENRFESDFYQPATSNIIEQIKKEQWDYLGDLSLEINRSGLRERKFVENGIPLITGQNLNMARLQDLKNLSKKFTRNVEKNTTNESDILISVQGTIGKVEYVFNNMYQGVFASEQLAKIKIDKEKVHPGYVYAFLKSKMGQSQLVKHKTGSVIEWVKENNIGSVIVPIPNDNGQEIGSEINRISKLQNKAFEKETQAIDLIEKEIESWQ